MRRDFPLSFLLSAAVLVLLAGCGDDVTKTTNVTGARTVADLSAAGVCGASALGELVLNEEDGELYVCDGAKWKSMKGAPGEPGHDGAPGDSGAAGKSCVGKRIAEGLEIACGGVVLDTLTDGEDGDPGAPGDSGAAGLSCTGRKIEEVGVEISCGNVVVDTIRNGLTLAFCGEELYDVRERLCDIRDSSLYDMVRIGDRTWMKQNLNYDYKIDGVSYGSYCYDNNINSCAVYGRLYSWAAAMDSATTGCGAGMRCAASAPVRGVCPHGWHLPDTTEWYALFAAAAESITVAARALKTTEGWRDGSDRGTNSSGFSALPSGQRDAWGGYNDAGTYAYFWSSSEVSAQAVTGMYLSFEYPYPYEYVEFKDYAVAVRCVKN